MDTWCDEYINDENNINFVTEKQKSGRKRTIRRMCKRTMKLKVQLADWLTWQKEFSQNHLIN